MTLFPEFGSKEVSPYHHADKVFVWRNRYTEGYKIGLGFESEPLDLSNYLFIRTRERLLLENKVNDPQRVMKNRKANPLT
jgi:hypothetical protein